MPGENGSPGTTFTESQLGTLSKDLAGEEVPTISSVYDEDRFWIIGWECNEPHANFLADFKRVSNELGWTSSSVKVEQNSLTGTDLIELAQDPLPYGAIPVDQTRYHQPDRFYFALGVRSR